MMTKERPVGRIKANVLRWLGLPLSLRDGDFWTAYYGRDASSGKCVTVDTALQLSTVWACVRLISETIATLPLGFYERMPDGSRREARSHNLFYLLHNQPSYALTAVQFWELIVASALLVGDGFAEKRTAADTIVALDFLNPQRMRRRRLRSGAIEYSYLNSDGTWRVIPEENLFRVQGFGTDGDIGLSAIEYGANVFGAAMAADEAAAKIFANGMRPSGILTVDKILKDEQREQLRERLLAFSSSTNAGKTLVAEAGMTYQQLTIPPEDAQLLQTRGFSTEEICRWFRVPPHMVGHTAPSTSWGTGIEQQQIGFLIFSLRPWLARIEQAIQRCLLSPAERQRFYAEFSIEGLLRADSSARAAYYSTAAQNGWMSRNEIRRLENLPPVDGGDALTVQVNLLPLDQLGRQGPASEQLRSALLNFLGEHERCDGTATE